MQRSIDNVQSPVCTASERPATYYFSGLKNSLIQGSLIVGIRDDSRSERLQTILIPLGTRMPSSACSVSSPRTASDLVENFGIHAG